MKKQRLILNLIALAHFFLIVSLHKYIFNEINYIVNIFRGICLILMLLFYNNIFKVGSILKKHFYTKKYIKCMYIYFFVTNCFYISLSRCMEMG